MSSIKKELFSGVFYTAIARYSSIIISLVITGILSRLLAPDDFGTIAIATVIIAFFGLFTDMGISPAIIQNKELTHADYSNIFSFTFWIGLCLFIAFFSSSWAIASYYQSEKLITICQLLSINLFFAAINIVPNSLFFKNKEFKFIAKRTLFIQIISGTLAITVALLGGGLYALVISPIISSLVLFLISIRRYPQKLSFTWGLSTIKKIFSYSTYQFLFSIINYFSRNLDTLLIGKYLNMDLLGYYEKSYRMMTLPIQNITHVITPVIHPIFSNFQNDLHKLAYSYERIVRLLAFIGFPLSVLLFFSAEELIILLFGNQWYPSIPVFKILSFTVGIQIVLSSSGSIFQASGDTRSLFICGLFSSILNVSGILTGLFVFQTLEAIACFICVTFTINFFQCYWMMYKVTFKLTLKTFFQQLLSPICISIILSGILLAVSYITSNFTLIISAATKGLIWAIVLAFYVQYTKEYDILGKVKSFFKSKTNE